MKNRTIYLSILLFCIATISCNTKKNRQSKEDLSEFITSATQWFDDDENLINAHGGGIIYFNETYYWYGEYKGDSTYWNPKVPSWECYRTESKGVSCYSSKNLVNWKFERIVLPAELNDTTSDLHYSNVLERPKVIFNEDTQKFVMWLHIDNHDYSKACAGVAISDSPNGIFQYLGAIRPNNEMSRDMTLFKDDNGEAYHIYSSEDNRTLYISKLTPDYLEPSGSYTRNFIDQSREAPAIFKRNNKYYLITSGCTGWDPNQAEYAVADSIMGEWKCMGNPCIGEGADITYLGQSTAVIKVENRKDAYIAMFDKWNKTDLINSSYIWLPIKFNNDSISIEWRDSWSIKDVFME